MNNATKGILFALLATLLWSGNMVVASGRPHSSCWFGFWRWTVACIVLAPFALKVTINDFKIIRNHFAYLALTAVMGITVLIRSLFCR
jgi:drug/metabolite transporter (DMT)-like permease